MNRMIKRNNIWLRKQCKRAAAMLPLIVGRAAILAAVCLVAVSMAAFYADRKEPVSRKLRIGYVADNNMLTELAVSYVQDLESVRSLCVLESMELDAGKALLERGELAALAVFPPDLINEILSGSNAPVVLYLPETVSVTGTGLAAVGDMLFRELADAVVGMLGTAQAEIYASPIILDFMIKNYSLEDTVVEEGQIQSVYDDINHFNLRVVGAREDLFRLQSVSVTENNTFAVYYTSAAFAVYLLLSGLFCGRFYRHSRLEQDMANMRLTVCYAAQFVFRCLAGLIVQAAVSLLPFLIFLAPAVRTAVSAKFTIQAVFLLGMMILFTAIYFAALYQLVEQHQSALTVIGVLAVLQAYISGCLVPSVLLPEAVAAIGKVLPAGLLKAGFTVLFTGDTHLSGTVAVGLALWSALFFVAGWLTMVLPAPVWRRNVQYTKMNCKVQIPSIWMVMLQRLLHRRSIWICMGIVAVVSVTVAGIEQESQVQVRVAVYDKSGNFDFLFTEEESLIKFEQYDSDKAVKQAVIKGQVDCGYILPDKLGEELAQYRAVQSVTVYHSADAVIVPVVNEVLFERIFRQVSLDWYTTYMLQENLQDRIGIGKDEVDISVCRAVIEEVFHRQLASGATFGFEIRQVNASGRIQKVEERKGTYPVWFVAATTVLLCALQGGIQVIADIREQRFYKRNRLMMAVLTMLLPVMLGILTGVFTLFVTKIFF